MKALLAKSDALGANTYAPSLFTFFSDDSRAQELKDVREKKSAGCERSGSSKGRG